MTVFFTSDQHFGHARIIDYCERPFSSVEEMTEAMITRHNEVVTADDFVWHLGDFALGEKYVTAYLPQLNGHHYLVAGNHDRVHSSYADSVRRKAERIYKSAGFTIFPEQVEIMLAGFGTVMLCHMPLFYSAPDDEARRPKYDEHRPRLVRLQQLSPVKRVLLHGHVHEKWKHKLEAGATLVNVGVDQWDFAPVAEDALVRYLHFLGC